MSVVPGLVSAIIPVHNRPVQLREAVGSVLAQTYRPIEVIIVDDGSTDGTGAVADELAADHPGEITVIHGPNRGPGGARETGRLRARGEFIQYLDSDDVLLPEKLERQVAVLSEHFECDVAYGWTRYLDKDMNHEILPWKRSGERIETMFPSFLTTRWWGTSTPIYRRDIVDRVGAWTDLRCEEDWEYDCRAASLGTRLAFVPDYVSEEREHTGPRLSRGGGTDPEKLRDRARAHELIYGHAVRAGIGPELPEMRHFARELFLLARQCGAAGLGDESSMLFQLAKKASGPDAASGLDFKIYRMAATILGWRLTGRLACFSDRFRK